MSERKSFKEIAKEKGKQLLVESYSISLDNIKIEEQLTESTQNLQLIVEGKEIIFEAFAILRRVPVTRFSENRNGRVYPRMLWERIYKERIAEGTLCLADHPDDNAEGSVTRVSGVWHNFQLGEDAGYADLYLVGPHGKLMYETIKAGGKIGMSSVGYGELKEDSKTVDPFSYELSRLGDAVLEPSQGVFATTENLSEEKNKKSESVSTKESGDNVVELLKENVTASVAEKKPMLTTLDKLQESNFKNQIRTVLKEANNALKTESVEKLVETQNDLKEVYSLIPEEMSDQRSKLEEMLENLDTTMKNKLKQTEESTKHLSERYSELKEKYKVADSIATGLKEKYKKAVQVIEKLGGSESNVEKLVIVEDMMNDIKCFKEDFDNMSADMNILMTERADMESDITILTEERQEMLEDIKCFLEDMEAIKDDMKAHDEDRMAMENDLNAYESTTQNMEKDLSQFAKDHDAMEEDIKQFKIDRKNMKFDIKSLKEENSRLRKILEDAGVPDIEGRSPYPQDVEPPFKDSFYDDSEVEGHIIMDPAQGDLANWEGGPHFDESAKKSVQKKQLQEKVAPQARKPFTESFVQKSARKDIQDFYERESLDNPSVQRIKAKVLGAKSLIEAVKMVESYKHEYEDVPMILESTKTITLGTKDWTEGYN